MQRPSDHLVVDRADRLPDADGLDGQRVRRFRIAIVEQREHRGARGEKGMLGGIGLAVQQSARALQPAFGDALFAAERGAVPGEPDRDASGRRLIAALAIGAKRALARIEDDLGEVEPPGREAETFERLRRFLNGEQPLEGALRLLPLAGLEGRAAPARSSTG